MNKLTQHPRIVFLVDGIGALISALLLVCLLAPNELVFGMPQNLVYQLSVPAFIFAGYSLGCYILNIKKWKPFLSLIALANFIYCCITGTLMIHYYQSLTLLGLLYFSGEILIVFCMIGIELKTIRNGVYN